MGGSCDAAMSESSLQYVVACGLNQALLGPPISSRAPAPANPEGSARSRAERSSADGSEAAWDPKDIPW